jgi:hypothetical protein
MFGALAPLPLRLGGDDTNGLTARQHARYCADLLACFRAGPFAKWSYTKSGATVTISGYSGRNGTGIAHAPNATVNGDGDVTFMWGEDLGSGVHFNTYQGELGVERPFIIRAADAAATTNAGLVATASITANSVRVRTFDLAGTATDVAASVATWGDAQAQARVIGDYGGDLEKEDSSTEGVIPYAAAILLDLQKRRGSAYTQNAGTLVDAENVALARLLAAAGPRQAEKLRANATPRRSDEKLDWWRRVLAVPTQPGEPGWRTRQKVAAHYRLTDGPTGDAVRSAVSELLGDAFVGISWDEGASLSAPPDPTYWPGVNPGNDADSLGGGAWLSTRCHLFVEVIQPSTMSLGAFLTLVNVDLKTLLDRMLPAWATFDWGFSGGFLVSADETDPEGGLVDFTGL